VNDIRIVPTDDKYAESLRRTVDTVARERKYIGFLEGPPIEKVRTFVQSLVDGAGVQMLALAPDDAVVGWCDIARNPHEGFRHGGRLGMGLLPRYRGRGLGRILALRTIHEARKTGIERIELEVFGSNAAAIALYESLGFVTEGIKQSARKLDGEYDDMLCMALLREPLDNRD
jgi:ribosomal protein S18 acetylase RimI-like enzyme